LYLDRVLPESQGARLCRGPQALVVLVRALGGTMAIRSGPGTQLRVKVPVPSDAAVAA
jgi:hypothetical protein